MALNAKRKIINDSNSQIGNAMALDVKMKKMAMSAKLRMNNGFERQMENDSRYRNEDKQQL